MVFNFQGKCELQGLFFFDVPQAMLLDTKAMDSSSCSRQGLAMGRIQNMAAVSIYGSKMFKNKAAECKTPIFTIILRSGIEGTVFSQKQTLPATDGLKTKIIMNTGVPLYIIYYIQKLQNFHYSIVL